VVEADIVLINSDLIVD